MSNTPELVVLVDEDNNVLGTMLKSEVHTDKTPLHRAFSVFIFNAQKQLLLQQRSHVKKTWPLVWSTSCCGHPGPGEPLTDAVTRRVGHELGMRMEWVREMSPYRYQFTRDGVMENEICPIFVAYTLDEPVINPLEVEATTWMSWDDFMTEIHTTDKYSPWCVEEAIILDNLESFRALNLV